MSRVANISFNFWGGLKLDKQLLTQILNALPADAQIIQMADDVTRGTSFMRVESKAFKDITNAMIIPEIAVIISTNSLGIPSLQYLDMKDALAAPTTQGAPTSCTRAGCWPANPCFMCHANANSTSLPVYAVPSPWGQQAAAPGYSTSNGTYTVKLPPGLVAKTSVCSHKWKSYTGLNETYEYCELPGCGVKRA